MSTLRKPVVAPEHEFEPQHGLPERLPEGERILWQGSPTWTVLARRAWHADVVALYFGALLLWRIGTVLSDGGGLVDVLRSLTWLVPLFATGLALLLALARMSAQSTVYTLTNRRVVMRVGIVLTVTYNLPLTCIDGASLRSLGRSGHGDLVLALQRDTRIAWLQLWPHVRPWKVARPQPMLRSLADVREVSALLGEAWARANGTGQQVRATPAASPAAGQGERAAPGRANPILATQ